MRHSSFLNYSAGRRKILFVNSLNNNNIWVPLPSPAVLPSVGRREPERSEGDRSATDGKTGAAPSPAPIQRSWRRPSVAASPRNTNTASWPTPTGPKAPVVVGALLRREGLYSSLLTTWRRERDAVVLQALAPQKRGPKSKRDPVAEENQQLRRETVRLTEALRKAEIVIDIQKKVAALLGRPILTVDPEEKP